jgi:Ca-activated chloride channel family protein
MRARVSALLILVCLIATLGAAQDRGTIAGTITDEAGSALPGVTVALSGPEKRSTITDTQGRFSFVGLLPGEYQLRAELLGFNTVQHRFKLAAGGSEVRKITMPIGTVSETVTVMGESARVGGNVRGGRVPPAPMAPPMAAGAPAPAAVGYEPYWPGRYRRDANTEAYDKLDENPFRKVSADPLSTFSIDVDTASYANVRRFLNDGTMPPKDAVRIEELVNYFRFNYPQPTGDAPFSITTELAECPWNPKHRLALIGLQGREIVEKETPARNLVFLVDVSGSMMSPDKLPLVRHGLRMLTDVLTAKDRVAIVVYAGSSGLVLPSTPGDRKSRIERAIEGLEAGGSTNGGAGIRLAYHIARENFIKGAVNRVILATDGDFNVGVTSQDELVSLIEKERESGVFLSVLGVGTGNLKDSTMEKLADKGNGNYAYLDSLHEARKVLVKEAGATLVTIAKDVKIQVEFNPKNVNGYRLIGYENRMLANQDFNDDTKDAGEIGAGHSVTAIYEIVPAGVEVENVDPLKYSAPAAAPKPAASNPAYVNELVTVKLRYKAPDGNTSRLVSAVILDRVQPLTANLGFASSVAEAGMLLRGSQQAGSGSYNSAVARARKFRGDDPDGYRAEFIKLVELASSLKAQSRE